MALHLTLLYETPLHNVHSASCQSQNWKMRKDLRLDNSDCRKCASLTSPLSVQWTSTIGDPPCSLGLPIYRYDSPGLAVGSRRTQVPRVRDEPLPFLRWPTTQHNREHPVWEHTCNVQQTTREKIICHPLFSHLCIRPSSYCTKRFPIIDSRLIFPFRRSCSSPSLTFVSTLHRTKSRR